MSMHFKDQVTPAAILAELVCHPKAQPEDTESFCHLKHDRDLYPRFYDKAERILSSFDKYTDITYDIQRPSGGADIVMRYSGEAGSGGEERCVAIQIKSFDEFEADEDFLPEIKAQIEELEKDYGTSLERYVLLLCTEYSKHLNRVRAISDELRANDKVIVAEPHSAWSLFAMDDAMIDAVSDRLIYSRDYVRRQARDEIAGIGKRRLMLLLSCLIEGIEERGGFAVSDDFVMHNSHVQEFEEQYPGGQGSLSEDVTAMEGKFFFREADVDGFEIYQDSVSAVVALYYDAKVRYGHTGDEAVHYLFTFLERDA